MRANNEDGSLRVIPDCFVAIPGAKEVQLRALPDLSDQKSVAYNDEPVIARSFPLKTYSHSENRTIGLTFHFYTTSPADLERNLSDLRAIESAAYPRNAANGAPFLPPPVCKIKCGKLLGDDGVCAVLRSYNVRFPPDVPWEIDLGGSLLPYKFDVDTTWDVVYVSTELPGQEKIFKSGS